MNKNSPETINLHLIFVYIVKTSCVESDQDTRHCVMWPKKLGAHDRTNKIFCGNSVDSSNSNFKPNLPSRYQDMRLQSLSNFLCVFLTNILKSL